MADQIAIVAGLKHMTHLYEYREHGMNKHDSQLVGQDYDNKCIPGYSRKDERNMLNMAPSFY